LQRNINPAIAEAAAVEMLAQHIITKPVFEALFEGYSFVKNNPISVAMQAMLDLLEDQQLDKDTEILQNFTNRCAPAPPALTTPRANSASL
jgi:predicted helicase